MTQTEFNQLAADLFEAYVLAGLLAIVFFKAISQVIAWWTKRHK